MLSSIKPEIVSGRTIMDKELIEASCLIIMNECSAGWPLIQGRIKRLATRIQ